MDNLTPTLNDTQIKQNIDALQKQGVSNDKVQAYVNNYSKGSDGNYILKSASQNPAQPTVPKAPLPLLTKDTGGFGTALKDVAVGAGKDLLKTATGLASTLQGAGQRVIAGFMPGGEDANIGKVQATTGINALNTDTPTGAGVQADLQPASKGEQTGGILSEVAQTVAPFSGGNFENLVAKGKSAIEAFQASREAKATADSTAKITDMISPKPTVKEARLAQTQGRFVDGKAPTTFRAGTEDTILPSKKTVSAANTVSENIPGASKMSPSTLYSAIDDSITKKAQFLRPQMEATPIKPQTAEKINSEWDDLKQQQLQDAPKVYGQNGEIKPDANVINRQQKFESLLKKSGSGNHADLWDTRVNYDNSIPDNVKKATIISPESLQAQKEEWLQNRAILNDAINDNVSGMGPVSQKAFSDMSDLYEAKNGLLSQTKVSGAKMSKFNQFLKDNPKVSAALGGASLYEIAKHLGVPLP